MGTSLFNTTPQATYPSLIKLGDNLPLTATLKALSDGLGNDSVLALSTISLQIGGATGATWDNTNKRLGIGTSAPIGLLDVSATTPVLRILSPTNGVCTLSLADNAGNIKGGIIADINSGEIKIGALGTGGYFPTIYANNAEAMRIDTSRNVGIGVSTITARLQVKGSGATSGTTSLLVQNSAGTAALTILDDRNVGIGTSSPTSPLTVVGNTSGYSTYLSNPAASGSSFGLLIDAGGDSTDASLRIRNRSSSSDYLYVRGDGNVGIGTSAPTDGLTIKRNSTGLSVQITDNSTGYNEFAFRNAAGTTVAEILSTVSIATYGTQNGGLGFFTNGIGAIPQMVIASAGNIGVNIITPTARLQIKGSGATSATTSLLVQNSAGTQLFKILDDRTIQFNGGVSDNGIDISSNGSLTQANSAASGISASYQGGFNLTGSVGSFIIDTTTYNKTLLVGGYIGGLRLKALPAATDVINIRDDTTALLECVSTTKGFLPPRMTTAQKNAIATPAAGLMVYDSTLAKLCVYTTAWETVTSL